MQVAHWSYTLGSLKKMAQDTSLCLDLFGKQVWWSRIDSTISRGQYRLSGSKYGEWWKPILPEWTGTLPGSKESHPQTTDPRFLLSYCAVTALRRTSLRGYGKSKHLSMIFIFSDNNINIGYTERQAWRCWDVCTHRSCRHSKHF